MNFWNEHGTKILGWAVTALTTIQGLIAIHAFDGLLTETAIRWLGIFILVATGGTGAAVINRGSVNTAQIKVATAIDNALKAQPPETK